MTTRAGYAPITEAQWVLITDWIDGVETAARLGFVDAPLPAPTAGAVGKPPRAARPTSPVGYLTLAEAGALVCASPETVRYWIWQGRLQAFKPGRLVLVKKVDVLALVESGETVALRAAKIRAKAGKVAKRAQSSGAMRGQLTQRLP